MPEAGSVGATFSRDLWRKAEGGWQKADVGGWMPDRRRPHWCSVKRIQANYAMLNSSDLDSRIAPVSGGNISIQGKQKASPFQATGMSPAPDFARFSPYPNTYAGVPPTGGRMPELPISHFPLPTSQFTD